MKTKTIIYWISTAVMCAIFAFSAYNYFFNYEMIEKFFTGYNYPTYIIYPLAVAKVLGIIAVLTNASRMLAEWAYAGFFFDAVLALVAHRVAGDGGEMFAIIALVAVLISRLMYTQIARGKTN